MEFTQFIVLTVIASVAEVLPLGRAGHDALIAHFLRDWSVYATTRGQIAVHLGLVLAILAYFWRDVADMVTGIVRAAKGKSDPGARLALQIVVATIPTLGLVIAFQYSAGSGYTLMAMGWTISGGALALFLCDRMCMTVKRIEHANYLDAILVSLSQAVALIPGVGASAIMVVMARLLGYERAAAVRFALLLMAPVLALVAARNALAYHDADGIVARGQDFVAVGVAFMAALVVIAALMAWLRRSSFLPFAIYRLVLGGAVLALAAGWFGT